MIIIGVKGYCTQCGKEIKNIPPCKLKRNKNNFCSPNCYAKWRKINIVGSRNPAWKGGKIELVCKECGNKFKRNAAQKDTAKFCDRKCEHKWQSKHWKGSNSCHWKGGPVRKKCLQCGKDIDVKRWKLKNGYGKYCSEECMGKAMSGSNSRFWQGGISFGKYCPKFNKNLKKRVRDFFNNKCVLCGRTEKELGRALSVHHVDYEKEDCCNGNRDPLFVPLCTSCHVKTNVDREEWELFFRYYLALGYNNRCFK